MIMKRRSGKAIGIIWICMLVMMLLLTGCGEKEQIPIEEEYDVLEETMGNEIQHNFTLEGINFTATYNTGDYDLSKWRVTKNKSIHMKLTATDVPEGTEIILEHMHVDVFLHSSDPTVSSVKQDEMDDSFHGYSQDGFPITENYGYENIFSIEGYNQTSIQSWTYFISNIAITNVSYDDWTEEDLIRYHDVDGNTFQIVYDIMIKHDGEKVFHTIPKRDIFGVSINRADMMKYSDRYQKIEEDK